MTVSNLVSSAALAGVASHLVFHYKEPKSPLHAAPVLLVSPLVLLVLKGTGDNLLLAVPVVYVTYLLSLSLSITIYRLSPFHPLAQYPGPTFNKITKISGMLASWTGKQHLINKQLHDQYGPVVRTGPNELSIIDVDAVTSVLGAGGLPKGQYYEARQDPNAPRNLVTLKGEAHANRRRLWNRGMSTDSLKEYEGIIRRRAEQFVDALSAKNDVVDMASWFSFFTFDFMGDMAFGGGFEMLRDGKDADGILEALDRFSRALSTACHVPKCSLTLQKIPAIKRDIQTLRKFGVERATERVKAGSVTKDLWYHLSDEIGMEKEKPPVRDVVADGLLAILAGSDTTASTMTCLLYHLLHHPNCYSRLKAEVDAVFPASEDPLDCSKHGELVYLNACINETLRLHPPVSVNGPRQVPIGTGGRVIAGRFVPEGTQVYVPAYSLQRSAEYFPTAPNDFVPERWLKPEEGQNAAAFIPFSYGPAGCVGKNIARQEMLMVFSMLTQKLQFSFAEGFDHARWPETLRDFYTLSRGPLLVNVKPL